MDVGRAFSFVFEDTDWIKKLAVIGLLSLIPIVGWFLLAGWTLETTRRVIKGDPTPLPDLSDFGLLFSNGLKVFAVVFVAMIPAFLISLPGGIIAGLAGNSREFGGIAMAISMLFNCLSLLYSLLLMIYLPAALGALADTDEVGRALNPASVLALVRAAPATYIIVALLSLVASIIGGLGAIACFIGVIITYPYGAALMAHLMGQAYVEASGTGAVAQV